ncbi:hypothetical protein PVK06_031595 [Gossypium arboreum]|uniref:Uncharacterized protein n=1 Tax=Gossypium arboreum TaxID=29729 RepID=A0ABR0NU28_GOSAR|nr:hypothetical protein PVK06_031595 [Gossypium arboreum]
MVQGEANQKDKGKAIVKEPMKISLTFAPALNQPLSHAYRLFLMPQSSASQKLKIEAREPQNHYLYSYKDKKSLLEAMAADFLSEQKTISGFLGLGTSSGRTLLNPALHLNLRNLMME